MATSRHNIDPSKASHWEALATALNERRIAARMDDPAPIGLAIPGTGLLPFTEHVNYSPNAFFDRLAESVDRICQKYIDKTTLNKCIATVLDHGGKVKNAFSIPHVASSVPAFPLEGLPLHSQALHDYMDAVADSILACADVSASYIGDISYKAEVRYWPEEAVLIEGDGGKRAHFYGAFPGTFTAFAIKNGDEWEDFRTDIVENDWNAIGTLGAGGGAFQWPSQPVEPQLSDFDYYDDEIGFSLWQTIYTPTFTPLSDLIGDDD